MQQTAHSTPVPKGLLDQASADISRAKRWIAESQTDPAIANALDALASAVENIICEIQDRDSMESIRRDWERENGR